MSRYNNNNNNNNNRQGNRSGPGRFSNSQMEWKPKPKVDASLHDDDNSKNVKRFGEKSQKDDEEAVKNFKNTPMSLHADSNSKMVNKSVEKPQKDDVGNFKNTPMPLHADGNSKKVNKSVEKSQKDDEEDVGSFKNTPMPLDADNNSKMVTQVGEISQKDDEKDKKIFKNSPMSIHADDNSKKVKKDEEKSQNDDGEDVVLDAKNFKNVLISLDADDESKKVKKFQDKSQNDDHNERLNHSGFDICPKKDGSLIKLKPPILVTNRERRKQSMKGQNITVLRPGMVLMKGYISSADQISIVKKCRELGISDGGFYQPGYSSGTKLHLKMMCLGKNWDPETSMYSELRPFDNTKPPAIPEAFHDLVKKAIQDSNEFIRGNVGRSNEGRVVPNMSPDICIVNFYSKNGRLGLHQDKDESEASKKKGLPVVSFSIGDSAEFLYGETRAVDEAEKVTLESGDVLIFGGKSRLIYHGVTNIVPDTAPKSLIEATDMSPGRLNLTFRKY